MKTELQEVMAKWDSVQGAQKGRTTKADAASLISIFENHRGWSTARHRLAIEEVMSTDSFPLAFADTVNRLFRSSFRGVGTPLQPLFTRRSARDFKGMKSFDQEGLVGSMPQVVEGGEYTEFVDVEGQVTYTIAKYGKRTALTFEAFINGAVDGMFTEIPGKLATSAMNTRARFQTNIYLTTTGPRSAVFVDSSNGQASVAVTTLTLENLESAIQEMQGYKSNGEPILNRPLFLVVPPASEITARQILTSTQLISVEHATSTKLLQGSTNIIPAFGLNLIVDPWIPVIATSKKLSWWLTSDPAMISSAEWATLAGREDPQLSMKDSNQRSLGGGEMSAFKGSFENDTMEWRVRDIFGGAAVEPRGLWGSTGAGS